MQTPPSLLLHTRILLHTLNPHQVDGHGKHGVALVVDVLPNQVHTAWGGTGGEQVVRCDGQAVWACAAARWPTFRPRSRVFRRQGASRHPLSSVQYDEQPPMHTGVPTDTPPPAVTNTHLGPCRRSRASRQTWRDVPWKWPHTGPAPPRRLRSGIIDTI